MVRRFALSRMSGWRWSLVAAPERNHEACLSAYGICSMHWDHVAFQYRVLDPWTLSSLLHAGPWGALGRVGGRWGTHAALPRHPAPYAVRHSQLQGDVTHGPSETGVRPSAPQGESTLIRCCLSAKRPCPARCKTATWPCCLTQCPKPCTDVLILMMLCSYSTSLEMRWQWCCTAPRVRWSTRSGHSCMEVMITGTCRTCTQVLPVLIATWAAVLGRPSYLGGYHDTSRGSVPQPPTRRTSHSTALSAVPMTTLQPYSTACDTSLTAPYIHHPCSVPNLQARAMPCTTSPTPTPASPTSPYYGHWRLWAPQWRWSPSPSPATPRGRRRARGCMAWTWTPWWTPGAGWVGRRPGNAAPCRLTRDVHHMGQPVWFRLFGRQPEHWHQATVS